MFASFNRPDWRVGAVNAGTPMNTQDRTRIGLGAVAGMIVVAAAVVTIGNNTGTQAQRCDRFWQSSAASTECHQRLADAEMDRDAARSAELQGQIDARQRRIDQTEQNIRNADRALIDLRVGRP